MENNVHIRTNGANRKAAKKFAARALGVAAIVGAVYGGITGFKTYQQNNAITDVEELIEYGLRSGDFRSADFELGRREHNGGLPAEKLVELRKLYNKSFARYQENAMKEAARREEELKSMNCLYAGTSADDGEKRFIPDPFKAPNDADGYKTAGLALEDGVLIHEFRKYDEYGRHHAFLEATEKGFLTRYDTDEKQCELSNVAITHDGTTVNFVASDTDVMAKATIRYRQITRQLYDFQNSKEIRLEKTKQDFANKLFDMKLEPKRTPSVPTKKAQ